MKNTVLVTGASGFIGFHVAKKLLSDGHAVIGYDNENDYYDVAVKEARRHELEMYDQYSFVHGDIENATALESVFETYDIEYVCNLAGQAGVRYSIENPRAYMQSNLDGFFNVISLAEKHKVKNFVYASSSSVYGDDSESPFSENQPCNKPVSFYAATKKANEVMAHAYSHIYTLPTTGLRFFTVYGPYGRPDMAPWKFTKATLEGGEIDVYNEGKCLRGYTHVDDIARGVVLSLFSPVDYRILNLGSDVTTTTNELISAIERACGVEVKKNILPAQPGDVEMTSADATQAYEQLGWKQEIGIKEGIGDFVNWYRGFREKC